MAINEETIMLHHIIIDENGIPEVKLQLGDKTLVLRREDDPVDVREVIHAKWIKHWHNSLIGHEYEECSICGCMISDTEKFWDCSYCPRCGALMDL